MFENLIKLVTDNAGDAIINNPAIPNENNEAAIQTTAEGITSHLKQLAGNGSLTDLFNGGNLRNNPVIGNIAQNVAGSLMSKFGIDSAQASGIVSGLIPKVMDQFVSKTNDPSDKSFDLQDMIGKFSAGNSDLGGMLNQVKGFFGN